MLQYPFDSPNADAEAKQSREHPWTVLPSRSSARRTRGERFVRDLVHREFVADDGSRLDHRLGHDSISDVTLSIFLLEIILFPSSYHLYYPLLLRFERDGPSLAKSSG